MIKEFLEKLGIRIISPYEKQLLELSKASLKLSKLHFFVNYDIAGAIKHAKKSVAYFPTEENTKWGLFLARKAEELK